MTTASENGTSGMTITRIYNALAAMIDGREPQVVTVELNDDVQLREIAAMVNKLAQQHKYMATKIDQLTNGDLTVETNSDSSDSQSD